MAFTQQATLTVPSPASGTHTNFSVPFKISDTKLKPIGSGGLVQNSGTMFTGSPTVPYDLVLTSDIGATVLYSWLIESWDQTNGIVYGELLIASYTTSVTVYFNLGDSATTTWQGGSRGAAYDTNTVGSWPFPPGSGTLNTTDFSSNAYDGTNSGATATTGQIDGAANFGGAAGVSVGANKTNLQPASITVEAWIKPNSTSQNSYAWAVTQDYTTARSSPFSAYGLELSDAGVTQWAGWFDSGGGINKINSGIAITVAWHHIVMTVTSGSQAIYIDGVSRATSSVAGALAYNASGIFTIGRNSDAGEQVNAIIDAVKVAKVVRSAAWVATMYSLGSSIPLVGTFVGGTAFTKSLTDTITVSDSLNRAVTVLKTEVFTLVDSINRAVTKGFTEVITLVEVFRYTQGLIFHEIYTLVDTLLRSITVKYTEVLTLVDTLRRGVAIRVAEVYTLVDILRRGLAVQFTEVISILERFSIRNILDAAVTYWRRYLLDISEVKIPISQPQISDEGLMVDPAITYFRQYLGRI